MLVIAAFWLLLVLPGLALLRRVRCPWLAYGLPSSIALGYLTTFALLTPISIAGYLFRWPLWVLSGSAIAAVLIGALSLLLGDRATFRGVLRRVRWWSLLGALVILVDAILGLRSGSHTSGDAVYHMSRVRALLDFGFNNWDPLIPGERFDSIYHTNLYHALLASSAQLARLGATEAWVYSWMFAKLISAGAMYFLAFVIFRRRWLAWVTASMFAIWQTSSSVMPYPNTLASLVLFPVAFGLCIEAMTSRRGFWPALGLGVLAVVSVQLHGLYYVLWCSLVVPVLLSRLVYLASRRRFGRAQLLASVLALAAGTPWLAITAQYRAPAVMSFSAPAADAPESTSDTDSEPESDGKRDAVELGPLDYGFWRLRSGQVIVDPSQLWDVEGARFQLLLALAAGVLSRRRREFVVLAAITATLMTILYVPIVCTAFVKLLGAPWIVMRYVIVHEVVHIAICPAVYFSLVPLRHAGTIVRMMAVALAFAHAWNDGVNYGVWTRKRHFKRALGHGREAYLAIHNARRKLYVRAITPGNTVVINPRLASSLLLDCPCYPLALTRNDRLDAMPQRRADAEALLSLELDLPARVALLKRHRIRHLVVRNDRHGQALRHLYAPLIKKYSARGGMAVMRLDLKRMKALEARAEPVPTPE